MLAPQDPEAMMEWDAQMVMHMLSYQTIKRQIAKEMSKSAL